MMTEEEKHKNISKQIKRKHTEEQKRIKGMLRVSASSTTNICGQGRLIAKTIYQTVFK